jgi:hypothetical protein
MNTQMNLDSLSLNRARFEQIRREFVPGYKLTDLKYLRDKAKSENTLRELYRGRAPYELLQNADDAGATRVAFILQQDGLAFAHDGHWFTVENFRSLADGWSDKNPAECIGHKGLGFRSVLDISPAPHILKVDTDGFLGVKFTWALNNGHFQEAYRRDTSLKEIVVSWEKHGQSICPIMAIPGLASKYDLGSAGIVLEDLSRGKYHYGKFTTMFWFPLNDPNTQPSVLKELAPQPLRKEDLLKFLQEEVSVMLPFLASVTYVEVYEQDRRIGLRFLSGRSQQTSKGREVTIHLDGKNQGNSDVFYQARFTFEIPPYIKNHADTPKAVKNMAEAEVVLSVQLNNGQPIANSDSCFHVYFPTQESTGVGIVVHGDFFVKPDRTRLMDGHYNEWLLGCAARAAANDFLTELLRQYDPQSIFAALSPIDTTQKEIAPTTKKFVKMFAEELQAREEPFLPTLVGLLGAHEVILPPRVDQEGFWEGHFSEAVNRVATPRRAFLSAKVDSVLSRKFFRLAKMHILDDEALLDFIDASATGSRSPEWWYDCYVYMENTLSRLSHSHFAGHNLLPTVDSKVAPVPEDGEYFVCLPPMRKSGSIEVPALFSSVFTFLNTRLAELLTNGEDTVRNWVLDRLRITRFEATSFLPRAVRTTAAQIYGGAILINPHALKQVWIFMKRSIDLSRTAIPAESLVWHELGRFPLTIQVGTIEEYLDPGYLVPAFLCYWPKAFAPPLNCLSGVAGLRRVNENFLVELLLESGEPEEEWWEFFNRVGVSTAPKLLQYKRLAAREELAFSTTGLSVTESSRFTGERQTDENHAVMETLAKEGLWISYTNKPSVCGHGFPRAVQALTLLEGLSACVNTSVSEFEDKNGHWHDRLWSLVRALPAKTIQEVEPDSVYCRGGGGHASSVGSYLQEQLDRFDWLPTTLGPANRTECFLRLKSRRLIATGRMDEEIGDVLLPHVIVENTDQQARLELLGVEPLDDASSASSSTMLRALALLGEKLSTDWGQKEILSVRSRWRLVRGAIQEMYRTLNQFSSLPDPHPTVLLSIRAESGNRFCHTPVYYADPGSAIERAFINSLPLLDADRPYPSFFEYMGIYRLDQSGAVHEKFLSEDAAEPVPHLQNAIIQDLAPFLLATLVAKVDTPKHSELVVRRLKERFEVKAAHRLALSFSLATDPSITHEVTFPKFYLQRRRVQLPGAVHEIHYVLYINANSSISLSSPELDADALGEAIAPLFLDGTSASNELENLFSRITTRYQMLRGNREALQEYLYLQLEISQEAQDSAWAMLAGDIVPSRTPPPPVQIVHSHHGHKSMDGNGKPATKEIMQKALADKVKNLVNDITDGGGTTKSETRSGQKDTDGSSINIRSGKPTPEQQLRGRQGEEEIKRRLNLSGGWEGFTLREDKRENGCGFDFLCSQDARTVKLEIKTFSSDGRVVVTSNELREAAASGDEYYLIGVLDNGKPENEWNTFLIQNPINLLLSQGTLDLEAKLQVSAREIFAIVSD